MWNQAKEAAVSTKKKEKRHTHQWTVDFLFQEFKKESDRAAVIMVAALIDEALTALLKNYFVSITSADDGLFENPTSPLSTFSAKIDICYRMGLISVKLSQDIHLIRKIRNSFAHDIYGCNFESWSVKTKIDMLRKNLSGLEQDEEGSRDKFLYCSGWILWCLNSLANEVKKLKVCNDEWLY